MPESASSALDFVRDVAADCGWPAVSIGRRVLVGERGWRAVLEGYPRPMPRERVRLLGLLRRHLLVVTAAGRERLRGWLSQRRTHPFDESPAALRGRLWEDLPYYGDVGMLPSVVEAFATLPPPVRDVLIGQVAFLGTGWSTDGITMPSDFIGRDGQRRTRVVLLNGAHRDPARLTRVVRHECGHAWLLALPDSQVPAITACGYARVLAQAQQEGWFERAESWRAQDERQAEAFAIAWGWQ
jgi:hypothetical protein